jgi:RecB family exonuclease
VSALCLVPTPLRAARAARRLCDAEGGLLFGARVETPGQLAAGVLAAAADGRRLLSPLAERMLACEAARAAGGPLARLDPAGGLARAAARLVAELREAEVPAGALAAAARGQPGAAAARLALAAALLGAYEARLAELGALDRAGALRAAAEALARGAASPEVAALDLLVLDGFTAAGPGLWALVAALAARARRTHARVAHFPERPDLDATEPLLRRLEGLHDLGARGELSISLERLDGERAERVAAALAGGAGGAGAPGEVRGATGAGAAGEAEAVADAVAGWIARGIAPDDVALVSAAPVEDAPRLARALAARGIALAAGRGPPLASAGAARVVRDALAAAPRPGRRELEALLASSYLRLDPPPRTGELLDRAGAEDGRGDPEAALRDRAARVGRAAPREAAALLRAADACAALARSLAPLAAPGRPREHAARLRGFVAAQGLRRRAARAEPDVARRDLAALTALEDLADEVAQALSAIGRGGDPLAAAAWRGWLDAAADGAAIPGADPAAGAVALTALSEAPGLAARAAAVVGCARGRFPAAPRPEPLLGEAERAALNGALGRAALATAGRRRAEARHAAFCALAAGREAVLVSWAGPGPEGPGDAPAPLALELLLAAGAGLPAPRPAAPAAPPEPPPPVALPAPLLPVLHAALPAEWTPSQLETHARCPFRAFLEIACRLREGDEADLDIAPRDEGSVAHAVLERFLAGRAAAGAPLRGGEAERAALAAAAGEVFARFEAEGRVGDPALWPARRALVLARLERVLEAEAAAADGLAPALVEHRFGGGDGAGDGGPALEIAGEDGEVVRLRGRVDRVDASAGALRVLDWKNARDAAAGRQRAQPERFGDDSFQLPAYLLAAARALPGRARLEAGYVFLRSASRSPLAVLEAGDPLLALDPAARAAARDAGVTPFADAVVGAVRRMRGGEFPIAPRDCDGCPFGAVCRAEGSEEAGA